MTLRAHGYRRGTRQPAHTHDALQVSLVLTGCVAETVGGVTEYAGPLSVVAKDSGVRHAVDFGPAGARLAQLSVPGATLGALADRPGPETGWRWTHDLEVAAPFLRLVRRHGGECPSLSAGDPDLVDLLAALTARSAPPPRGQPPAWLADTMLQLRQGWSPQTTVGEVARRAGVHPVYLARSLRRWYGTGVAAELRRQRLRAAIARLPDHGATVSSIAHHVGFADEPHLCRELRRAAGITPGRYRSLVSSLPYQWRGGA